MTTFSSSSDTTELNVIQAHSGAAPTPPMPIDNDQIYQDIDAWLASLAQMADDEEQLRKLLVAVQTMKNPMLGVQEIMMMLMQVQEDGCMVVANLGNIETDLRNDLTQAQDGFNSYTSDVTNGKTPNNADLEKFIQLIDKLCKFVQGQLDKNGVDSPFDKGSLQSLLSALNSIKDQFGANGADWGNEKAMAADIANWINNATKNGSYSPQLNNILQGFNEFGQEVSGLSMATNTELAYETKKDQELLGDTEATFEQVSKLEAQIVQNQKSS